MGRRKPHKLKIREERLDKLDETKMEVAIWLLAKGKVEDRTRRSQPGPPKREGVDSSPIKPANTDKPSDTEEAA